MKNFVCVLAFAAVVGVMTYSQWGKATLGDTQVYQTQDNQYTVIVVQDGISTSQAKQMARQRAAEIVVRNGYRYFTIDSEEETQATQPDQDWENTQAFPTNLYQEKIVEKDFGKQSTQNKVGPAINTYPTFRLVFTIQPSKPFGRSVDACTLTNCQ